MNLDRVAVLTLALAMVISDRAGITAKSAPQSSDPTLQIQAIEVPDGQAGDSFEASLNALNGTPPYDWAVSSGVLPPGLTLDASTGTISGIPTGNAYGQYAFTLQVSDSGTPAQIATGEFTIDIAPADSESGVDYYVSPTGDDSGDGSAADPWLTINHAASSVRPGDVVHVLPGTYYESSPRYNSGVATTISGTAANRIRFVSQVKWGAKVVFNGPAWNSTLYSVWANRGDYVDVQGFDITGNFASIGIDDATAYSRIVGNYVHDMPVPCRNMGGGAIDLWYRQAGNGHATVDGNVINNFGEQVITNILSIQRTNNVVTVTTDATNNLHGYPGEAPDNHEVYISSVSDTSFNGWYYPDATPDDETTFTFSQPGPDTDEMSTGAAKTDGCGWVHGIYFQTPNATIINNIISNVTSFGITNGGEALEDNTISNNLIFQCGAGGMGFSGNDAENPWANNTVSNNILVENGVGIYEIDMFTDRPTFIGVGNRYINNLTYNNVSARFGNQGQIVCTDCGSEVIDTMEANPLFVNYTRDGNGDYHLTANSPAIDSGVSDGAPDHDFEGTERPLGSGYDRGPYEQ